MSVSSCPRLDPARPQTCGLPSARLGVRTWSTARRTPQPMKPSRFFALLRMVASKSSCHDQQFRKPVARSEPDDVVAFGSLVGDYQIESDSKCKYPKSKSKISMAGGDKPCFR